MKPTITAVKVTSAKHSIELEIKDLDRTVKHKLDWLKNAHLAEIKKLRAKRRVLQKELSELG